MNCGQKKSGRGTLCKTCYQQKRGSYVSLSCDNCGKDFTKRNTSTTKDTKWWNLLIAAKVVLKTSKLSIAQKCIVCNQPVPKRTMKYCSQECRQSVKRNRNCNAQIATKHFTQHQQEQFIVRGNVQTKHTANA